MPTVSLLPNLINRNQHRSFTFVRDILTLVTKQKDASGTHRRVKACWAPESLIKAVHPQYADKPHRKDSVESTTVPYE